MDLNYRNKFLIIIAFGLIFFIVSVLPFRVLSKLSLREEYDNINRKYDYMVENLKKKPLYENDQEDLLSKVSKLNIDREISQAEIIRVLDKNSNGNIQVKTISFSEIEDLFQDKGPVYMRVRLDFHSEFESMLTYIDNIKSCERKISISDISIFQMEGEGVNVVMNLIFYGLDIVDIVEIVEGVL